jgi:hypothetical protein
VNCDLHHPQPLFDPMMPSNNDMIVENSRKRKVDEIGGNEVSNECEKDNGKNPLKKLRQQNTLNNPASPILPSTDYAALFEQECSSCTQSSSLPAISSNVLTPSEFSDELECAICRETFLKPYTLQCSHTFCKRCITSWMKVRKSCPTCRKLLTRQPVYNMTLDKVMQVILKKQSEEEQQEMARRQEELEKEESEALQRFIATVETAKARGVVFLNIATAWNDNERLLFKTGVERYEAKARRLYCELTNFSLEFVQNATPEQLETACKNLGFLIPRVAGSSSTTDYSLIRMILKDFLVGV